VFSMTPEGWMVTSSVQGRTEPLVDPSDRGALQLLILVGDTPRVETLPEGKAVCVGRGEQADIQLDEPAISRRHFTLHIDGGVQLEDLGSANGTTVRGRLIRGGERVEVNPGDTIEVGRALLVLQRRRLATIEPVRILSHEYIQERVEEECRQGAGRVFALFRLRATNGRGADLQHRLVEAQQPSEVVGQYGPDEYELLALGIGPEEALGRANALASPEIEVGVSCHPRDGRTAAELVERASPGPPVATGPLELLEQLGPVLDRVAPTSLSVLLVGETGVGKGVLAMELHRRSSRREEAFVPLHCAEFPESLLEAELFGYERGAFTGAVRAKPGLVEAADGGTLFLDEVGEIPREVQVKLLRVLENREVRRLGSVQPRRVDVRIVSASGQDLERACAEGRFRPDLYFRLNGITLWIPPLRERRHEIEPLARQFIAQVSQAQGTHTPVLTPEAVEALRNHPWPGNVRELRNAVERAVALSGGGVITPEHLPSAPLGISFRRVLPPAPALGPEAVDERARIAEALEACAGNQSRAAKRLGISRRTLVSKLAKFGFPRPLGRKD
jgi:two-component system response regulator AtoC